MNKKCFFGIAALFFFSAAFAKKSDVQLFSGLFFTDFEYSVSDNRFFDSGFRGGEFSVSNFNFFGEENHFGFFERLSFQAGDFFGAEFAAGPAFCATPNDFLRIQASPFFRLGFEFEKIRISKNMEKHLLEQALRMNTEFCLAQAQPYSFFLCRAGGFLRFWALIFP